MSAQFIKPSKRSAASNYYVLVIFIYEKYPVLTSELCQTTGKGISIKTF